MDNTLYQILEDKINQKRKEKNKLTERMKIARRKIYEFEKELEILEKYGSVNEKTIGQITHIEEELLKFRYDEVRNKDKLDKVEKEIADLVIEKNSIIKSRFL